MQPGTPKGRPRVSGLVHRQDADRAVEFCLELRINRETAGVILVRAVGKNSAKHVAPAWNSG